MGGELSSEESQTWGALCTAVWLLLVPCPTATSSLSHHPELLNYMEKSTALWCLRSPSAQHCSVWHLLHPYPDLSTDPAMVPRSMSSPCLGLLAQTSGTGDTHGNCSQCPSLYPPPPSATRPTSWPVTRDGADPALFAAPFPYHVSGLSCCLAVLLSAWLPAWLSLSVGVMHSVLTCLAFTHNMVKLYSQPHLSGSNQNQANKGRDGTLQKEKHLYF